MTKKERETTRRIWAEEMGKAKAEGNTERVALLQRIWVDKKGWGASPPRRSVRPVRTFIQAFGA